MTLLLEQVKALPLAERAKLAQEIWESLIESGHEPRLTPAQERELDRRLRDHTKNPDNVEPWDAIQARLDRQYGKPE